MHEEKGENMHIKITFHESIFSQLQSSLRWDDGKEKATYLLCNTSTHQGRIKLLPDKVIIPKKDDYIKRSPGYYSLAKPFINRVVNEAIETDSHLIQCHVHPGNPGIFSGVDAVKEPQLMRHIADKVDGIFHASLVFGNSLNTLDGWFYDREKDKLIPIEKVLVVGREKMDIFIPWGSPLKNKKLHPSLSRSVMAFGEEAMEILGMLDIGVVGASALGGPIVEFCSRDKVRSLFLCDLDSIDETNLNRLSGTIPSDIGKNKAIFYAEKAKQISSQTIVVPFPKTFYDFEVQEAFSQADVIFGCVDSGARHSINQLALANNVPYFDLGATIQSENGNLKFVGGQVYSIIPGRGACLSCSGSFDHLLSEYIPPDDREMKVKRGYIKDDDSITIPLVAYLDYIIAGLGYREFLKYILGLSENEVFKTQYNEMQNKIVQSRCSDDGCLSCQSDGFLGKGDKVPIMVPREKADLRIANIPTETEAYFPEMDICV
ncbi:ThiF family adenylyltransferase [Thermodesulfobacteriota bacterium]